MTWNAAFDLVVALFFIPSQELQIPSAKRSVRGTQIRKVLPVSTTSRQDASNGITFGSIRARQIPLGSSWILTPEREFDAISAERL